MPRRFIPAPTRAVVFLALLPLLAACGAWRTPSVSPARAVTEETPGRIRVTLRDSSRFEMEDPVVVGDTLRGEARVAPKRDAPRDAAYSLEPRDVALADIAQLEVRRSDVYKPILLIGGIVALAYGVAIISFGS